MMRCVFLLAAACVAAPCSADLGGLDVPLTIRDVAGVPRKAEPCSTGVPLPAGLLKRCEGIAVFDAAGAAVPAQFKVLERWREYGHDGSIKWLGVTFLADVPAGGEAVYRLKAGKNPPPAVPVRVGSAGAAFTMGGMKFAKNFSGPFKLVMIDLAGRQITASELPLKWEVVEAGPVRAVIKAEAPQAEGKFSLLAWITAYAGLKRYDLTVVVGNTGREADGPLSFRDCSVIVAPKALKKAGHWAIGAEPEATFTGLVGDGERVTLYQDSDGSDRWDKLGGRRDYNAAYVIPWSKIKQLGKPRFRGYRVTSAGKQIGAGNYALGWSALTNGKRSAILTIRHFRENYPSAIEVAPGRLIARLWPDQWQAHGGIHWLDDLQRKRHDLSLRLLDGDVAPAVGNAAALGFNRPLIAHCGLDWYRKSGAVGRLLSAKPAKEVKVGVYPGPFASEANWVSFGGECIDRIKRRYHQGSMGRFISGGDPWAAYRMLTTAAHSSGMNCTHVDDYQHPRDVKLLSFGHYCSPMRKTGAYPEGTGHHGFMPWNVAHYLCRELFDAWRLAGDEFARDGARQVAIYLQNYARYRMTDPFGKTKLAAGTRADGHPMGLLCEAYRLFGGKELLASAKELTDVMWRQVNKQRGNYGVMRSWEGGKDRCEKPFMMCQNIAGLRAYYELTRDERTLDQITGMLDFILEEASIGELGFTYVVKLDPGAQEPYRKTTYDALKKKRSTSYTHLAPNFAWAHRYTGEPKYRTVIDGIDGKLYPHKSRAYTVYFPERTDKDPPATIGDLTARPLGKGKVKLSWTTPDGAVRIQLKHAGKPMVERCWPDRIETHANWWASEHVAAEPAAKSLAKQSMTVTGIGEGVRHFAVRTFDAADNRSAISNTVEVAVK